MYDGVRRKSPVLGSAMIRVSNGTHALAYTWPAGKSSTVQLPTVCGSRYASSVPFRSFPLRARRKAAVGTVAMKCPCRPMWSACPCEMIPIFRGSAGSR